MYIIYHSRDLDGYCSGAICKKKFPDATLLGYDYGEPIPELPPGEEVIMIDVSLPIKDMEHMAKNSNWKMTWIDHHIAAINEYKAYVGQGESFCTAILEDGWAACEIAWSYYFKDQKMPLPVELLGQYDTFRNKDKEKWDGSIMPFQYGMRMICTSAETFPMELLKPHEQYGPHNLNKFYSIVNAGASILAYEKEQSKKLCKKSFVFPFEGLRALCLNATLANSQVFESVYDPEKHDIMMPFSYTGKFWVISLYTFKDDIDCSAIAKSRGGGGHRKAAGFQVQRLAELFAFESIPFVETLK